MSLPSPQHKSFSEFDLIAQLTQGLRAAGDVVRGVGDDAAILNWPAGRQLVVTCDAQVEGTHFVRAFSSPRQIGRRALSVNLSDIAAMGARPRFALISLILPSEPDTAWLNEMYAGLREQAEAFDVTIVGGNIATTTGPTCIDITLIGDVAAGKAVRRDGGRAGDRVYISGDLGTALAGLESLRTPGISAPRGVPPEALAQALEEVRAAYRDPWPRVLLGAALGATGALTAMIDISDGFSSDLHHICEQSGVGALVVEAALPVSPATRLVGEALGHLPLEWALHGGDAYQLLFTVSPEREADITGLAPELLGHIHAVGWLTAADQGVRLRHADGTTDELAPRGWDHLKGEQW